MPSGGDSDADKLTSTEMIIPREKLSDERERETDTADVGSGLDTPNHERTPMAEEGKQVGKKDKPPLDSNVYSTKKTVAQGMMDLALLTSNAAQLKMLLKYSDQKGQLFAAHVTCLSLSIILQVIVGVLLILNSRYNINRPSHHSRADLMNNATVVGVFLITVVNVLASSFDDGR